MAQSNDKQNVNEAGESVDPNDDMPNSSPDNGTPDDIEASDVEDFDLDSAMYSTAVGTLRTAEFEKYVEKSYAGWVLPNASNGYGSDLFSQANYKYLKGRYDFLENVQSSCGFDSDTNVFEIFNELEEDEWDCFLYDLKSLSEGGLLDDGEYEELRSQAEEEWFTDDGIPDFQRAIQVVALDSYTAFCAKNVNFSILNAWMNENDVYPEIEEARAWADVFDPAVEDPEATRNFIDEHEDEFYRAGSAEEWKNVKLAYLRDPDIRATFDEYLDQMAQNEVNSDTLKLIEYAQEMDEETFVNLMLHAVPDTNYASDATPAWRLAYENNVKKWLIADEVDDRGYPLRSANEYSSLREVFESTLFKNRLVQLSRRIPHDHPELPFTESRRRRKLKENDGDDFDFDLDELADETSPLRRIVYEDDVLRVFTGFESREELNSFTTKLAKRPVTNKNNQDYSCYVFDDKKTSTFLGTFHITGTSNVLVSDIGKTPRELQASPQYAQSYATALETIFAEPYLAEDSEPLYAEELFDKLQYWSSAATPAIARNVVLKILRKEPGIDGASFVVGMANLLCKDISAAASNFRDPQNFGPNGYRLKVKDWRSLTSVFRGSDESRADEILNGDYEPYIHFGSIDPLDAIPFLTQDAKKGVRSFLLNKEVELEDGELTALTADLISEYSDDELIKIAIETEEEFAFVLRQGLLSALESQARDAYRDGIADAIKDKLFIKDSTFVEDGLIVTVSYAGIQELVGYYVDDRNEITDQTTLADVIPNSQWNSVSLQSIDLPEPYLYPDKKTVDSYSDVVSEPFLEFLRDNDINESITLQQLTEKRHQAKYSFLTLLETDASENVLGDLVDLLESAGNKCSNAKTNVTLKKRDELGHSVYEFLLSYQVFPRLPEKTVRGVNEKISRWLRSNVGYAGGVLIESTQTVDAINPYSARVEHRWTIVRDSAFELTEP